MIDTNHKNFMGSKYAERMLLYNELNAKGQLFVDGLAQQIEQNFKVKRQSGTAFGVQMGRELALAILEFCWSGEDFPSWLSAEEREAIQVVLTELEAA
jgi:hypothetical protein